ANASIDGAKIANATIGSAKIASLDASKITTGKIQGIEMDFETGRLGGWYVRNGRMDYAWRTNEYTVFKPSGDVVLATGVAESQVGIDTNTANMQIFHDGKILFRGNNDYMLGGLRRHSDGLERPTVGSGPMIELSGIRRTFVGERSARFNGLYVRGAETGDGTTAAYTLIGTSVGTNQEKSIYFDPTYEALRINSNSRIWLRSE